MAHLQTQTSLPLIYTTMYSFQFEIAVNIIVGNLNDFFFRSNKLNSTLGAVFKKVEEMIRR